MNAIFDPNHFFDAIYCISIAARHDRRQSAERQFEKLGILSRVEFVLVEKHPTNQEEGIYQSHMECLRRGLQAEAQHILVFEDDILIKRYREQTLSEGIGFLEKLSTWDGFFLGAISGGVSKTAAKAVLRIKYRCLAHAYVLNRPFAQRVVQKPWDGTPFDDMLREEGRDFYGLFPMIGFQSTASSDNQTVVLDRMRRIFGGLPLIQRSNELFQRYKPFVVLFHLLVVVAIVLMLIQE